MAYTISEEDRAIWRAAKEAQDVRTGKARPGLRRSPKPQPCQYGDKRLKNRYIKRGRVLYYKDLKTGEICHGTVIAVSRQSFTFRFGNNRTAVVPLGIVDDRLFYTAEEARRFGRSKR